MNKLTFIDLFCGCGGFSLGMERAGFGCLAAVDFNREAIVAHLSKDGLMFIYPTQNRSLTPREAARIQSFPYWFEFSILLTHQFRVIGNALPPQACKVVGRPLLN